MVTTSFYIVFSDPVDWIPGAVGEKISRFFKCLIFSKSGSAIFSDLAGCQKWPSLAATNQQGVMVAATIYVNIIYNFYTIVHDIKRQDVS